MDQELTIDVAVRLVNTAEGVKAGGILQHVRREIAVTGLPDKMVDYVEVDVTELNIGDAIHIGDINLPEGLKAIQEDHLTVAVVVAPTVVKEEVEEVEEELEAEEAEQAEAESEGGETTSRSSRV